MSKLTAKKEAQYLELRKGITNVCHQSDIVEHAKATTTTAMADVVKICKALKITADQLITPYTSKQTGKLKAGVSKSGAWVRNFNMVLGFCHEAQDPESLALYNRAMMFAGGKGANSWKRNIDEKDHKTVKNAFGYANSKLSKIQKALAADTDKQSKIKAGEATNTKKSELDRLIAELSKAFDRVKAKNDKLPESFGDERRRMIKTELETMLKDLIEIPQA